MRKQIMNNTRNNILRIKLLIIVIFLFGLHSCSYYAFPPKVDTRTEIEYTYKLDKDFKRSKWKKIRRKIEYQRYDKRGNVIEEGRYGEVSHFSNITKDSTGSVTMITGHGYNYKNLNTVYYCRFDSANKKMEDELWRFKDNKKLYLIYKTIFEYDLNGKLMKEIEFDEDNVILRQQDYSIRNVNQTTSKDSVFYSLHDAITRIDGARQDTITTDHLGRVIEEIHYYKDKFLYRKEFRYDYFGKIITELRYDNKPDSLWCITEWQYNFDKQLIRVFWKVIGDETETKDIYVYNRKNLLVKVLHYEGEELAGFTRYRYKLF